MSRRLLLSFALLFLFVVGGCGGLNRTAGEGGAESPPEDTTPTAAPVDGYASHPARIYVDGDYDDWAELPVRYTDAPDDEEGVDLERVSVAHDDDHLFLRLELGEAVNLQEGNDLTLYLDTDNNPGTGQQALGMGAELVWTFGERSRRVVRNGDAKEVTHAALGFTSLPTVTSETFEVAFDRSATPTDDGSLFLGDSLRVGLSTDADRLPDADGGLGYVLSDADTPLDAPSIDKPNASALRMLSYNSVNDFDRGRSAIFLDDRQPSFRRIFGATDPGVVAFQEVYDQTADQVATVANEALGLPSGWEWAKEGQDLVLGSRYPILDTHTIPGYENNVSGAFLLDADDALGTDLLVVNMHPPCCNYGPDDGEPSRNAQRQRVVDGVVAFLREVKQGEGPFDVPPETPIVVLGDMNFVGDAQQPRTLRTGEIMNTGRYGSAAAPDWDGSPLLDTNPRQAATPLHTTWIAPGSSFPPGRLDYAFVTDSVLEVVHEFVLHTPALPADVRSAHGLRAGDTPTASDHLPVVIDVAPR
ncbi:endonuclease/exonuclease/phosphatase family protein [Salinibacter grassmerensis]|uniref:endonuclease/exonuclease/phosphatase family protein n=1 Tax=Salinibacter grassmerensis TaxID=3040353 RepID=UPI0021E89D44|nr:endonuclease/exonuclease/phosphatase family protein [Salinibacter grassmerensis]